MRQIYFRIKNCLAILLGKKYVIFIIENKETTKFAHSTMTAKELGTLTADGSTAIVDKLELHKQQENAVNEVNIIIGGK